MVSLQREKNKKHAFNERSCSDMWTLYCTSYPNKEVDPNKIECTIKDIVFDDYKLMVQRLKNVMVHEIKQLANARDLNGSGNPTSTKPWIDIIKAMDCHKLLLQFWNKTARTWIHGNYGIYGVKFYVDYKKLNHRNANNIPW